MGGGRSVAVLVLGLVLAGTVLILAPGATESTEASANLPADAESALAQDRLATLPGGDDAPAVVVVSRDDGQALDAEQLGALGRLGSTLGSALEAEVSGPVPSVDGTVALLTIPLPGDVGNEANAERIETLRADVTDALPSGLTAEVTGAPAIQADLGAVFEGADVRLLLVTAAVVALLLVVTYRSPLLWLVPLAVVGLGDRVAAKVVEAISHWAQLPIDGSTTGITSVLVFGAGTNYALLLIARYREELRRHEDRREAMRQAVGAAGPAILSSSGTVVLGLLALLLADAPFVNRIGLAGAAGIVVAVLFALVVLPAAMSIPGRWLFWPFVPRVGDSDPTERGLWRRVGLRVTRRPALVTVGGLVVLALMALGTLGLRTGLGQDEQFLDTPESITAQQTLASAFPAGASSPTTVVTSPRLAEQVARAAADVPDVQSADVGRPSATVAPVSVVLSDPPGSDAALGTVERLRAAVQEVDPDALVGGQDAQALDEATTAQRDRTVVVPVVLVVVLGMLLLLLRSVVAAVLLVATTVLSYVSALGVGWLVFDHVLGWSAMDVSTPLLAFIFLVALGVDYNIFLTARAREEMRASGDATSSVVTALGVTGGVITSAGILLAAVFAVLGVLPLVLLAQLGVVVGFGVLLDTVLVRGVVTPALVAWCGRRFWWPSAVARAPRRAR